MGIIARQSLKASVGFYIGVLLGVINQMYVSTKFLSVEQLALSRLLFENALLFSAFSHLGAPFIADKFFVHFRNDEKKHEGILPFILTIPFIGGILFTLLYWAFSVPIQDYFADQSPMVVQYHFLIIPLTFFWSYISVLEAYCRNNARIAVPNFIREVYLRLVNIILVLMLSFGWISFEWMVYLMVASYGVTVLILVSYIMQLGKWHWVKPNRAILTPSLIRDMLKFGGFTLLGGIGGNLMLFIDRTMLAGERGLMSTGIFIIAAYIAGIIEIPRKAISQISIPHLTEAITANDFVKVQSLARKSAINQLIVGGTFFLLIWSNIDTIFALIPKGEIYQDGKYVVLLLAVVRLFEIGTGLNNEIILYSKYFRWTTLFIVTGALVALVLNLLLIPTYGFNGAAFATALTSALYTLVRMGFVWNKFKVNALSLNTVWTLFMLVIVYAVISVLPFPATSSLLGAFIVMGIKSLLTLVAVIAFVLTLRLSDDLSNLAQGLWNKLRRSA